MGLLAPDRGHHHALRRGGECAVIGVKDARWGERPLALIVRDRKTDPPVSVEDVKAHVMVFADKGVISKFAVPQKILFVDALAKTSVGKFDKKALATAVRRRRVRLWPEALRTMAERSERGGAVGLAVRAGRAQHPGAQSACRPQRQGSHGQRRDLAQGHGQRAAVAADQWLSFVGELADIGARPIRSCAASRRQALRRRHLEDQRAAPRTAPGLSRRGATR